MNTVDPEAVHQYLRSLQNHLTAHLRSTDETAEFTEDSWTRENNGGGGIARVFAEGKVWEKAGVNFSDVSGPSLPPSATATRPELANRPFRAMGVSLVFHPLNPHIPTTHMNVRFFTTVEADAHWWFGGGFDLTPYYPLMEDVIGWHQTAKDACAPFGDYYLKFKKQCDDYFYLPHRNETRGVGGLFFDDFNELGFEQSFGLMRSVGDAFWEAYAPIIERRKHQEFSESERQFQLYRRGRYVEFNLLYDRGTTFGLQSKGRTESILMSLPPLVRWDYNFHPENDTRESELYRNFLRPRDWIQLG